MTQRQIYKPKPINAIKRRKEREKEETEYLTPLERRLYRVGVMQ